MSETINMTNWEEGGDMTRRTPNPDETQNFTPGAINDAIPNPHPVDSSATPPNECIVDGAIAKSTEALEYKMRIARVRKLELLIFCVIRFIQGFCVGDIYGIGSPKQSKQYFGVLAFFAIPIVFPIAGLAWTLVSALVGTRMTLIASGLVCLCGCIVKAFPEFAWIVVGQNIFFVGMAASIPSVAHHAFGGFTSRSLFTTLAVEIVAGFVGFGISSPWGNSIMSENNVVPWIALHLTEAVFIFVATLFVFLCFKREMRRCATKETFYEKFGRMSPELRDTPCFYPVVADESKGENEVIPGTDSGGIQQSETEIRINKARQFTHMRLSYRIVADSLWVVLRKDAVAPAMCFVASVCAYLVVGIGGDKSTVGSEYIDKRVSFLVESLGGLLAVSVVCFFRARWNLRRVISVVAPVITAIGTGAMFFTATFASNISASGFVFLVVSEEFLVGMGSIVSIITSFELFVDGAFPVYEMLSATILMMLLANPVIIVVASAIVFSAGAAAITVTVWCLSCAMLMGIYKQPQKLQRQ